MSEFIYAAGDTVRYQRVPHRVVVIHLDGTVTIAGPRGLRTVDSSTLTPAKKGDRLVVLTAPAPARRAGAR